MKQLPKLLAVILLLVIISSCTMNKPICATSNPLGEKQGVYSQISILGIPPIANKNAAIAKAAENGGITNISTVDYNTTFLFFLIKYETIVTGN
ncbi:MAG: TRL-like family protein [Candidatus Cloacimonas sp.]|nr:TRL-like family protein [Candidatus Cloacimonas sp.]HNS84486.1 TRL domain-containing protein [Candidatus Cloacimonas sp.]